MLKVVLLYALLFCVSSADLPPVVSPPATLVQSLRLTGFYRKYVDAHGLPVLASAKVDDYALREAVYLIGHMLDGRADIREAMVANRVRLVVLAHDEMTTAVPEYSDLTPAKYWDKRARGLGATRERPVVSCGEENLLCFRGDPYAGENILAHEFAHAIHEMGLRTIQPDFDRTLKAAFDHAMTSGLWKGTYAMTNPSEYWAEGVQSWFDCNQVKNQSHNGVRTREQLKAHDPGLYDLISTTFRGNSWRYQRPDLRANSEHLDGYDASKSPAFAWDPALVEWYRKFEETKNGKP